MARAPNGSWKSPISAAMVAASSSVYYEPKIANDRVFFLEMRPSERGRFAIVSGDQQGKVEDVISEEYNARTRVHEYGGGSYCVTSDGSQLFFSNFSDQKVYRKRDGRISHITQEDDIFCADFCLDEKNGRIICVQEDHRKPGEALNSLVSMNFDGSEKITLASGNDFYSSPRLDPDARHFTYLTWNHPMLPFFGCELWVADYTDRGISNAKKIGGSEKESVAEPRWSPDGTLYFVSDRSNWWNIYRYSEGKVENVLPMDAEFAGPHWMFGLSSYAFLSADRIFCTFTEGGFSYLGAIDVESRNLKKIDSPLSDIRYVEARDDSVFLIGGSPMTRTGVYSFSLDSGEFRRVYPGDQKTVDRAYLSVPSAIEFPTSNGLLSHALYYAPKNQDYETAGNSLPPIIVISHGGPTSRCRSELNLGINYWTSRGFAVVDVNYAGSTGYGREYRNRLVGSWGVVDVEDCASAARYLAEKRLADPNRLIIRGGSAGGYTTLCALAFKDVFGAGASYFGISDLEVFAKDTHKFESRYLDILVGPLPEKKDVYRARSALNHLDGFSAPIIFFQGLEDKVVPPNQARMMFDALKKKGIKTACIEYEGEQHGFRQAKNIARSNEVELYFYSKIFGFDLPEDIEPVKIENQ